MIEVRPSPIHGRGVFATQSIQAGQLIESCPVLRFPAAQRELIDQTLLFEYYFDWDGDGGLALGYGSLYNHSGTPNAEYLKDIDSDTVRIQAITTIAAGEEITFSYSGPTPTDVHI
ncbi:MAG: SET domain-containing protein [Candidatus Dormibacteria bacterium]